MHPSHIYEAAFIITEAFLVDTNPPGFDWTRCASYRVADTLHAAALVEARCLVPILPTWSLHEALQTAPGCGAIAAARVPSTACEAARAARL